MASERRRETLVGSVAVSILAFLLMASHGSDRLDAVGKDTYQVKATFNRVDGINLGDEVQLAGVPIGTVVDTALEDNFRATLTFRIDGDVPLPRDTSAAIHTSGLFGDKFIVLEPGGELENLQPGDRITFTQDAQIIGELLDLIISEGRAVRGLPPQGDE